ncbi:MAG: DUF1127 domain-containing protein [Devosia sp.]
MTRFNHTDIAELDQLDARQLADIGFAQGGEWVHPSQLRALPVEKSAFAVWFEIVARSLVGLGISVRATR